MIKYSIFQTYLFSHFFSIFSFYLTKHLFIFPIHVFFQLIFNCHSSILLIFHSSKLLSIQLSIHIFFHLSNFPIIDSPIHPISHSSYLPSIHSHIHSFFHLSILPSIHSPIHPFSHPSNLPLHSIIPPSTHTTETNTSINSPSSYIIIPLHLYISPLIIDPSTLYSLLYPLTHPSLQSIPALIHVFLHLLIIHLSSFHPLLIFYPPIHSSSELPSSLMISLFKIIKILLLFSFIPIPTLIPFSTHRFFSQTFFSFSVFIPSIHFLFVF